MSLVSVIKKKIKAIMALLLIVFGYNVAVFASTETNEAKEERFNPTPTIMEHIADSHDWHLWGHTSLGLPVILQTEQGLVFFCSSEFHHDKEAKVVVEKDGQRFVRYHNKIYYANGAAHSAGSEQPVGSFVNLKDGAVQNPMPLDFSITKNVASMFLASLILLFIFIKVANSYKVREGKAPKGMQSLMEPLIVFVRDDIARPNIGRRYMTYMPFLLTIFFFIWINNLLGLIPIFPGSANLTGNISVTLTLGLFTFVITTISANKYYWKHILLPDVPWALYPIMLVVEVVGVFSKPISLIIRLFANITAGHIIVLSLISLIFIFKSFAVAPFAVGFVLFIDVIELLVAFLQAFIFTMLSALFIGLAVEEQH